MYFQLLRNQDSGLLLTLHCNAGGPDYGPAVASIENSQKYWKEVGCWLWNSGADVWWYIMQDEVPELPEEPAIAFGILPASSPSQALPQQPLFDLSCPDISVSKREKCF